MNTIIDAAFSRGRVVLMVLLMLLGVGAVAYVAIPKEANPEVPLPLVYVSTGLEGISPSDAERLLIEPMESEFAAIAGLEKIQSNASEGYANVQLEFTPAVTSTKHCAKSEKPQTGSREICPKTPMTSR